MSAAIGNQLAWLFILAIPISCITWTVTHEEIFREPREYCIRNARTSKTIFRRKIFYVFTCEYCFSHYVTMLALVVTRYHLLFSDWRGYVIGGFSLVWVANIYMSLYNLVRLDLKRENTEISLKEEEKKKLQG